MTRARRTVTGLALVIGGALLGLLSLTALPWFRGSFGGLLNFGSKPGELRESFAFYQSAPDIYDAIGFGISPVYFRWLGVVVLLVGALAAAATVGFDGRASRSAGLLGTAAGIGGVVLTALAIQVIDIDGDRLRAATGIASNPPGYLDYLTHTSFGAWGAVLGYLAVAVGGLLATGGRDAVRTLLNDEDDEPEAEATVEPTAESTEFDEPAEPTAEPDEPVDLAKRTTRHGENW